MKVRTSVNSCRFASECPYYMRSSYTCNHQGGNYCGKYRELETEEKKKPTELALVGRGVV